MKGNNSYKECQSSITVYLSLVLLLILSLLFTVIEGARVGTAKVFAERALTTAMDSALAQFYGPLWEEYHIFGLHTGDNTEDRLEKSLSDRLQESMSYTFHPSQGLNTKRTDLYGISIGDIRLINHTALTEHNGKLVINQAVEYMKYKEIGIALELLMEKMSLSEQPKKVSILYEEKQEAEEQLVEIDKSILELMELLDGIKTGKKGIEIYKDGSIKTVSSFVKKICFGPVTIEKVGINQESVFQAQKNNYIDPNSEFNKIESNFYSLWNVIQMISETEFEYSKISDLITEAEDLLRELNYREEKTEEVKDEIKDIKAGIKDFKEQREELQADLQRYRTEKQAYITEIRSGKNNVFRLSQDIKPCISSAIKTIDTILLKINIAGPIIEAYEKSLANAKDEIGGEIYEGMAEELKELKRYIQVNDQGYDFEGMKQTLKNNLQIIGQVEALLMQGEKMLSDGSYHNAKGNFTKANELFMDYDIRSLRLDYSTIVTQKSEEFGPLNQVSSLLKDGLTGLMLDMDTISKATLGAEALPSEMARLSEVDGDVLNQLSTFFENSIIGDMSSGMGEMIGSLGSDAGALETLGNGINRVAEHFLFQEYIKEHFYSYSGDKEDVNIRKPSVLTYEREYLLSGRKTDKDNLTSVISRIVFLRTILDFVSILGDRDKCNEAKAAASALVGFTGLPILVSITKTLILLVWAFAEATIDTSALLMGKEVPIIKQDINLSFQELFTLSPRLIQRKASELKETKELSFHYQEYLSVFLLLKGKKELAYRSMDLMQENIKVRYLEDYKMKDCIYGFMVEADFMIASKLTKFTFVQKQIKSKPKGFLFQTTAAYSY